MFSNVRLIFHIRNVYKGITSLWLGHRFDPNTPIEESMQALHDVVRLSSLHWNELLPCLSVYVFTSLSPRLQLTNISPRSPCDCGKVSIPLSLVLK